MTVLINGTWTKFLASLSTLSVRTYLHRLLPPPKDDFLDLTEFDNVEGFDFGDGVMNLEDVFDNFEFKNKKQNTGTSDDVNASHWSVIPKRLLPSPTNGTA